MPPKQVTLTEFEYKEIIGMLKGHDDLIRGIENEPGLVGNQSSIMKSLYHPKWGLEERVHTIEVLRWKLLGIIGFVSVLCSFLGTLIGWALMIALKKP